MEEKKLIQELVTAIRNLMSAAESNNEYDCDTQLQEAVADGELAVKDAEKFLKT